MEEFKFNNQDEIFEFLTENFTTDYLFDKLDLTLSEFDDYVLQKEVEERGYYCFEDEYDIKNYVEDSMDCYVFDRVSAIEEWVKENGNCPLIFEDHKSHIAPNYREETLELVEKLSQEKGWEWIHDALIKC